MKQYEIDENDGPTYYKLPNGTTELTETHFTSEHAILVSAPQHNLELFE
jgi:hypothetical protein